MTCDSFRKKYDSTTRITVDDAKDYGNLKIDGMI